MPWYGTAILICVFVLVDLVVVGAVMTFAVDSTLGRISKAYPGQSIASNANRRNFQSMSSGAVNLGGCIHIATDDQFLHLLPTAFLRLFKATPASIPWDAVELTPDQNSKRWITLRTAGTSLRLPAWILDDQSRGT